MEVFHSYGVSLAIWDHTVLPAIRHKWTRTVLTPAMQAGTRFTYPKGMEGWVCWPSWLESAPAGSRSSCPPCPRPCPQLLPQASR